MSADAMKERYRRVRQELAELFGYDLDKLTIDQELRIDAAMGIKLSLDGMRSQLYKGEQVDVGKLLAASEAIGRFLPLPPVPHHESNEPDPREVLLAMYYQARAADEDTASREASAFEVAALEMEQQAERARAEPAKPVPADNVVALKPEITPAAAPPAPQRWDDTEGARLWREHTGGVFGSGGGNPGFFWGGASGRREW